MSSEESNPYASPSAADAPTGAPIGGPNGEIPGETGASRAELRDIAGRQRAVLLCIAGYIGTIVLRLVVPIAAPFDPGVTGVLLAVVTILVAVAAMVCIFLLASKLYGAGMAVLCALCLFLPLIGLVALLVVNQKATKILQANGVKVGLLGADASTI